MNSVSLGFFSNFVPSA